MCSEWICVTNHRENEVSIDIQSSSCSRHGELDFFGVFFCCNFYHLIFITQFQFWSCFDNDGNANLNRSSIRMRIKFRFLSFPTQTKIGQPNNNTVPCDHFSTFRSESFIHPCMQTHMHSTCFPIAQFLFRRYVDWVCCYLDSICTLMWIVYYCHGWSVPAAIN